MTTLGDKALLRRVLAGVLIVEAIYFTGLTVLFACWAQAFIAFDQGEVGAGDGAAALTAAIGFSVVGFLAFSAVGLWRNWVTAGGRRRLALRASLLAVAGLHVVAAGMAVT